MKTSKAFGIAIGLCAGLLVACGSAVHAPSAAHVTPYVSVQPPAGDDWQVRGSSDRGITYARGGVGDSFVVMVSMFRLAPASTPGEFEALIRAAAARDVDPAHPDRYELMEESIAYTDERPYPCVRYRAVSIDHRARGTDAPQFLELDGLYCRHPQDPAVGAAMVYSHRGLKRDPALRQQAEAFLEGVALPMQ